VRKLEAACESANHKNYRKIFSFYSKNVPYFAINCYSELVWGCEDLFDKIKCLNKISIVLMEPDYSGRR